MKHFKSIINKITTEGCLFYLFLLVLVMPNLLLCYTEQVSTLGKITMVILPLALYALFLSSFRNIGKAFWWLFPFVFLGAFQIVLLYLFGESIIAVDMFLNLVTTNANEAFELLDKLLPAIFFVVVLYVPPLIVATFFIFRKVNVSRTLLMIRKRRALLLTFVGTLFLLMTYLFDATYRAEIDLYPVNVCNNIRLAVQRQVKLKDYFETSRDFKFSAFSQNRSDEKEVYVLVIGETSRASNWQLCGYQRATNPLLSQQENLMVFDKVLSESNTTHKSVPMLLSSVSAVNFDDIYIQKSLITAFKEAGFHTSFFSNQRYNHSFIDFFGKEADNVCFLKEEGGAAQVNALDEALLELLNRELQKNYTKQLIVLHCYGSHFNYRERYTDDYRVFMPDSPVDAKREYRDNLVNAYDNSILYTDAFLNQIINQLSSLQAESALLYTSDHGEDIFDDSRYRFLHASPLPSFYQIYVPCVMWYSDSYVENNKEKIEAARSNQNKQVSSSLSLFHSALDLANLSTPYLEEKYSLLSPHYTLKNRYYLNDHNRACSFHTVFYDDKDFILFDQHKMTY